MANVIACRQCIHNAQFVIFFETTRMPWRPVITDAQTKDDLVPENLEEMLQVPTLAFIWRCFIQGTNDRLASPFGPNIAVVPVASDKPFSAGTVINT
eukprot:6213727-Pleurochrysis_carterae.AAC.1